MLEKYGIVQKDYDLINNNTYKVHSICNYFIKVNNITKLTNLIKYLNDNNLKYFILGNGSNIILPSKLNKIAIKLDLKELNYNRTLVAVSSSIMLSELIKKSLDKNLGGLEWAYSIPGTIGGAVLVNAGAHNEEIKNYIEYIEVLENNKVKILKKNEIDFGYRSSSLKYRDLVIISVCLRLTKVNKAKSLKLINEYIQKRKTNQPLEYPNAGSVFKNPENNYAGKLIEQAGLKGKTIGGAKVSEKHANFIINTKDATGENIIKLINEITKTVHNETGIKLELEQIII